MTDETLSPLAVIHNYHELHEALREHAEKIHVPRTALDDIAGLQSGYCAKLLSPRATKKVGRMSLGALLGAMGLKLVLVEDHAALARVKSRLVSSVSDRAGLRMPARNSLPGNDIWKDNPHWGMAMRLRQLAKMDANDRRLAASKAAFYRWYVKAGQRKTKAKPP